MIAAGVPVDDPDRRLVLLYAPASRRAALAALWALDEALAQVLRTTTQSMVGQMRLTWWHERLSALGDSAPPAQPVLTALARHAVPAGATPAMLAQVVEGWEELLEGGRLPAEAMERHGRLRGGALFACAAAVLGASRDPAAAAGTGWALADFARHASDPQERIAARRLADAALAEALGVRWSRAGRPLGALAALAARDPAEPRDAPARVWRALRHRLTGR